MSEPEELRTRTKRFAVRIVKLCDALPNKPSGWIIAKQILRSGTSIAANYRAACRSRSKAEFIAKLCIVVEEADETLYWLELLSETGLMPASKLQSLMDEADQLTAIFVTARKTSRGN
jgi:four helix bundle protein